MFRIIPFIGTVVVSLTMTSIAWGTNYVWLEAEPLTDGAIVIEDGQGHAVSLECDPAQQLGDPECRWLITVRIANDDPMFGWTLDLGSSDDNTSILSVGYLEPLFSAGGILIKYIPFDGAITAIPGSGRDLVRNMGGITIFEVVPATESPDGIAWSVAEFILSKTTTDTDSGFVEIFGRTGIGGYGPAPGQDFPAEVGDNPLAPIEQPLTIYPNALITITSPQGDDYSPPGDGGGPGFTWNDPPPQNPGDNTPPSGGGNDPPGGNAPDSGNPQDGNGGNGNTGDGGNGGIGGGDSGGGIFGGGTGGIPMFGGSQGGFAISQGGQNGGPFTGLCGASGVPTLATLALMFGAASRRRRRRRRSQSI